MHSVRETLERPWVLGIDASIKPLYGRPEGTEIGDNPNKPMRPGQVLHTFLVANLRLVLDVQVKSGKRHTSGHAKVAPVRGDSGYGNEGILLTLEERGPPYLLRLRQTKNVQRLEARQFLRYAGVWTGSATASTLAVWALAHAQGLQAAWIGKALVDVMLAGASFLLAKHWIYR